MVVPLRTLLSIVLCLLVLPGCSLQSSPEASKIPVIYFSDLFHPHDDPDDHFDLLALYALNELDIRAIVLDQGLKQDVRPGHIPIEQLNMLTGRKVPWGKGLAFPLKSREDNGTWQLRQYQEGIELVLKTLRESDQKVTLISVGSMRDLAAAYNREPELFRQKVSRLYCFIGEARLEKFREYNVELDLQAFVTVMNSGLPVYWMPCFDGGLWKNDGNASYWQTKQQFLLNGTDSVVMNYFRYALLDQQRKVVIQDFSNTISSEDQARLFNELRNLWCTSVFTHAAGRFVENGKKGWKTTLSKGKNAEPSPLFTFDPVMLWVDDNGVVHYDNSGRSKKVFRFKIIDQSNYTQAMTEITNNLYRNIQWQRQRGNYQSLLSSLL